MIKGLFIYIFIVHVICDFYLQSPRMAEGKKQKTGWVFLHILIYSVAGFALLTVGLTGLPYRYCLLFVIMHAIIDLLKYILCYNALIRRSKIVINDAWVFVIDQVLHLAVLAGITYCVRYEGIDGLYNQDIVNIIAEAGIPADELLGWTLKLLLIFKPINILISNILVRYRPDEEDMEADKNAGRLIGVLERIIMTILISINQYSAVGFVLTAKSIARYDKISKSQVFAEYYLLGTLLSTICSIVIAVLI